MRPDSQRNLAMSPTHKLSSTVPKPKNETSVFYAHTAASRGPSFNGKQHNSTITPPQLHHNSTTIDFPHQLHRFL